MSKADIETAIAVIKRIAEVAHAVGWQANVGASEMAGQFVSVLARHPELVEKFMRDGAGCFLEEEMGAERGCLTFYAKSGRITTPEELHVARQVHRIKRATGVSP